MYLQSLVNMSYVELLLLLVLFMAWAYQFCYYLRYIAGTVRANRRSGKDRKSAENEAVLEPVSVIVCEKNELANLQVFLPHILTQDYPEYEVIVVDDGSEDESREWLQQMMHVYSNLRVTFVPYGARVRSSKKLALTLGIKAAKYDYILLTDADCVPESSRWIYEMMQGFFPMKKQNKVDVVLGYGSYFVEKSWLNKLIQFDTLFNGLQYLGMAYSMHPYMGVGRNLAYRKEVFVSNNGFSGYLTELAGDDDLFVNKVATSKNTRIVVSPASVTWSLPKHSFKMWLQQKERHLSVSPHYKFSTKFRLFIEPFSRGVFYATLIAVAFLGSWWSWLFAVVAFLSRLLWQLIIMNLSTAHFGLKRIGLELIIWDTYLPLNTIFLLLHYNLIGRHRMKW